MRDKRPPAEPGDAIWVTQPDREQALPGILVSRNGDQAVVQMVDQGEPAGVHEQVAAERVLRRKPGSSDHIPTRPPTQRPAPPAEAPPASSDPFDQLLAAIPKVVEALQRDLVAKHAAEEKARLKETGQRRNRQLYLISKAVAVLTAKGPLRKGGARVWTPEQREAARQRMIKYNRDRGRSRT